MQVYGAGHTLIWTLQALQVNSNGSWGEAESSYDCGQTSPTKNLRSVLQGGTPAQLWCARSDMCDDKWATQSPRAVQLHCFSFTFLSFARDRTNGGGSTNQNQPDNLTQPSAVSDADWRVLPVAATAWSSAAVSCLCCEISLHMAMPPDGVAW